VQPRSQLVSVLKIAAIVGVLGPTLVIAAPQVPPSAPVTVVNTSSNPVPVTGTVGLSGTGNVQVTNSVANPVPVSVANNAPNVIQITYAKDMGNLLVGTNPEVIYTVPAGFRLVIEYFEIGGALQSGEVATGGIYTTVSSKPALHEIMTPPAPSLLGGGALANQNTTESKTVRIYADPQTDVAAQVGRSDGTGHAFVELVINGYLQPLP
jgi:hypothetical protein